MSSFLVVLLRFAHAFSYLLQILCFKQTYYALLQCVFAEHYILELRQLLTVKFFQLPVIFLSFFKNFF
jgi:hypothetical protein